MGEALLMQKGEVVEPTPPEPEIPAGALYWEGNEITAVTGGWVQGWNAGTHQFSKEADHIYKQVSSSAGWTYIVTENKIDVSSASLLKVFIDTNNLLLGSNRRYEFGLLNEKTSGLVSRTQFYTNGTGLEVQHDVSGATGSYHVFIGVANGNAVTIGAKTYKVSLE